MNVNIGRVCLSAEHGFIFHGAELGISHSTICKKTPQKTCFDMIKEIKRHEVLSHLFARYDSSCSVTDFVVDVQPAVRDD